MELLSEILQGQKLKISYWEDTIVPKTTRSGEKEIEIEEERIAKHSKDNSQGLVIIFILDFSMILKINFLLTRNE